ncbi:MAG: hypothetical protein JXB85_01045 [Anaerolineales bacterium]|nr:hypothetical protein [Anaerolineales bacterium]
MGNLAPSCRDRDPIGLPSPEVDDPPTNEIYGTGSPQNKTLREVCTERVYDRTGHFIDETLDAPTPASSIRTLSTPLLRASLLSP